jgi:hypothetical protein
MRLKAKALNRQILAPLHARLTCGIYAAIIYCRKTNDIAGLQHDIGNSIEHVLNNHQNCRNYFKNYGIIPKRTKNVCGMTK